MTDGIDPDALATLAEADTARDLVRAHGKVHQAIAASRRRVSRQWGKLATAYGEAMTYWEALKTDGVSFEKRVAMLATVLRENFPKPREEDWHYLCANCDDCGLEFHDCAGVPSTCGRPKAHGAHTYGRPCFCPLGARFREKPKPTPSDFTQAGRSKPMSRIGR